MTGALAQFGRWGLTAVFALCLFGLAALPVSAQMAAGGRFGGLGGNVAAPTSNIVRDVVVQGVRRIDPASVLTYMQIKAGDVYDDGKVDKSLKALYATNLFSDVTIRREGNDIVVRVVENPVINRLAFEGNTKVKDETLQKEIQLKPRQVYTRAKVQADLQRILSVYRRTGRFAATVEPKVIQLPENRVDLIFEINEGSSTGIAAIRFIGNKQFSDGKLRDYISTRETAWWRFLSSDDTYDPDRITYDRELLRRFYLTRGYADFRVISAVAELAPTRDNFFLTFVIDEGERYKFGKITINSRVRNVDTEILYPKLMMADGDWYDAELIEKSIEGMTFELGTHGYAFIDIRPDIDRNKDARTISINFTINEAPRVYVEKINITGNVRTLDRVIRREMRVAEGDAFNSAKVRRSKQRISGLGYFDKVDLNEAPGTAPDKVNLNVAVQEKSTGEFSIGAGYSTTDGILGDVSIRERNLLGRGNDLRVGGTLAAKRQQLDLGFTEPYFLGRDLAAGFDIFARRLDLQYRSGYNQNTTGFVLRGNYPLTEYMSQQVGYTLRQDTITDIVSGSSLIVQDSAGTTITSAINQSTTYDRRDDRQDPTRGYVVRVANDLAGFGGNVSYIRTVVEGTYYYPLAEQYTLAMGGFVGNITGLWDDVRILDRFFLGGDNLRGFQTGGAGPRDLPSNQAVGGNNMVTGRVQLTMPIGLPNELGILGRVWTDTGMSFGVDNQTATVADTAFVRFSSGVGLSWKSPFGPIGVDLGYPWRMTNYDIKQLFRFSFGTRF